MAEAAGGDFDVDLAWAGLAYLNSMYTSLPSAALRIVACIFMVFYG